MKSAMRKAPRSLPRNARRLLHIGSVSYLNARPLIYGLDRDKDLSIHLAVPAKLLDGLIAGRFDIALLPVIDYQRADGLLLVPAGGIGSEGPTLTVRIFSHVPERKITTLACDGDSHTSVALARLILAQVYGIRPRLIQWKPGRRSTADALLLIGDKVVCDEPQGYEFQLDLGDAWHQLTGQPFVFAAWMTRRGVDLGDLPHRLAAARQRGLANIGRIIRQHAIPRGWPASVARSYLTENLDFDLGKRQQEAITLFHRLCARYGIIESPVKPLKLYRPPKSPL